MGGEHTHIGHALMAPFRQQQLPLPFPYEPHYDPLDFVPAPSNQEALAWLGRMDEWPDRRLAIWGEAGGGKTHLLRTWQTQVGAVRFEGKAVTSPEILPASGLVAIDDADHVVPETNMLHVLNTARDRRLTLLLTAREAPSRWPAALPDLSSRLRAITAVEIYPPDDDLLRALLFRLLVDRQLVVSESLQNWLLLRLPRSAAAYRDAVARLDEMSLADGKRISRAMAARLLPSDAACETQEISATEGLSPSKTTGLL
jgi:chromosomal replication initiation ATPase DnaA